MKVLPLSLMTASGSLWCLQTCLRKRCATPAESTVVMVGMAWMCLDSLSTATRMALYPLDSGSSPMVSTEIASQQWVGIRFGVSFPTFCIRKVGKLTPNRIPTHCWEAISVDTIGELPESKGYNAILVAVDRLSKHIHAMPTITTVDSAGVAHLFLKHVWRHHRLPEAV